MVSAGCKCTDPYARCALYGAAMAAGGIRGAAVVTHAPQGCDLAVGSAFTYQNVDFTHRFLACTKLCENEVVTGGEDKLLETLRSVAEYYPVRTIIVLTGCAADIIGDDTEAVCRRAEQVLHRKIVHVPSGGFIGKQSSGADLALTRLVEALADPDQPKIPGSVNLIAPFLSDNPGWMGDLSFVKSALRTLGVKVNTVLTCNTRPSDIARVTAAEANLLLSLNGGAQVVEFLRDRHGMPTVNEGLPMPIGLEQTGRWLRSLGAAFGAEQKAERLIARQEKRVITELKLRYLPIHWFHRQPTAVVGDLTIGLALCSFLAEELEMNVELFAVRPSVNAARESLVSAVMDRARIQPEVMFDVDMFAADSALRRVRPLSVFGSLSEQQIARDIGIRYVYRVFDKVNRIDYFDYPYMGYDGVLKLLEIIINDWRGKNQEMSVLAASGVKPRASDSNLWQGRYW